MSTRRRQGRDLSPGLTDAGAMLEIVPVGDQYDTEPVRETILIYHLPNFAQDRRSDLRAERVKVGSIDDLTRFDELFRVYASKPGFYLQEHRLGGQVAETKVVEVKPRVESLGDATAGAATTQTQGQASTRSISDTTEAIRATKELLKEVQPAAPALTPADIQKMIADGVRDALAQSQPAQPAAPPVNPIQLMREINTLQKEIAPPAPPTTAPSDPAESFLTQFEKFTEISERINPIREAREESRGWLDKVLGTVEGVAKAAGGLAPYVHPFLQAAMQPAARPQQPTTATQPAAAAGDAQAAPASVNPALEAMQMLVADLKHNKRVGRMADHIEALITKQPEYAPVLAGFLKRDATEILRELSQMAGEDLTNFRHAEGWIALLKEELMPEDEDDDGNNAEADAGQMAGANDAPNLVQMASERAS